MREKVTISLIDQGIMSAFNFALNIALLKWWSAADFGVYSIVFAVSFMLLSLQNALVNTPYSVLVPASNDPQSIRKTLAQTNLLLLTVLTLLMLLVLQLPILTNLHHLTGPVTAYLSSRLIREYLRNRWASELNLLPILSTDLIGIVIFVGGVGVWVAINSWEAVGVATVLWWLAISNLLCSITMLYHESRLLNQAKWRALYRNYQPIWQQARWSLVGVITTEMQNRGYVILIGAVFGSATVGFIQAGRVFFGPLNVITSAWTRVAKPTMARMLGNKQLDEFRSLTHMGATGFLIFNIIFAAILWWLWPLLQQHLFADQYPDIAIVVAQWAVINLLFHVRSSYSTAIQVQNRFKELAMATIWGAAVSLSVLSLISLLNQPDWVIAGVLIGEAFVLLYVINLFRPERLAISAGAKPC